MTNSFTVAGYAYQADTYCTPHVLQRLLKDRGIEGHGLSYVAEEALDRLARDVRIDRMDEATFDSDEFPKVIFHDQAVEGDDHCATCHIALKNL